MTDRPPAENADAGDAFRELQEAGALGLTALVAALVADWQRFVAALPAIPNGLQNVAPRERTQVLFDEAHRIHGSGGTFGYPDVSRAAAVLEPLLKRVLGSERISPAQLKRATRMVDRIHSAIARSPAEAAAKRGNVLTHGPVSNGKLVVGILAAHDADTQASLTTMISALGYQVRLIDPSRQEAADFAAVVVDEAAHDAGFVRTHVAAKCPVILLTDKVSFAGRVRAAQDGVTAVVPKPLDADELAGWLNALVGRGGAEPYSVLIVDDDVLLAQTYALTLQRTGMQATVVSEPARVFEALFARNYDLVMMHLQMPGVDGIDLARVIRQTRRFLFLPIIFVSAEEDKDRQLIARHVGGDDFISKPVDLDRLVRLVRLRAERARALRTAMERDGLTGLLTHGRFKERLHAELERCRRNGNHICLALMDLDHFKRVNDDYGHLVGDRVLRALARSLTSGLRSSDVVGRYGGEEFAVILMDTDPAKAAARIDTLRRRFGVQPFDTELGIFTVTLSVGVSGSAECADMETLIEAADKALYVAKREGRNLVRIAAQPPLAAVGTIE